MFDLRSALDHLMFQLWARHFHGKAHPRIEGVSQFPIYDDGGEFIKYRKGIATICRKAGITTLSVREWQTLRDVQPYVTRKDKWQYTRYWLGRLNTLHNFDKHRQLHVIAASQNAAVIPKFHVAFGGPETHPSWGPLKPDGYVETWTYTKVPPEVEPHHGALLQIGLEYGDQEWVELTEVLLTNLVAAVRWVFARFAGRFE
jgi:hypothetical protein